jgi:hypothetical protein
MFYIHLVGEVLGKAVSQLDQIILTPMALLLVFVLAFETPWQYSTVLI